ncbi:conserved hypothetical protein [Ricinus communis]|uniref:Uncharacterized protein n=1 Tax=Ricinus communis TaxID=3988 RepID=B9SRT7_RICCO|nr:conserved hypothetical protein [Ricinus communis]
MHNLRRKSGRKPLQPKNSPATPVTVTQIHILKPKQQLVEISVANKENNPIHGTPTKLIIEPLDASLAEELSAIRKKAERLKLEREKTEEMLNERGRMLDLKMKEMEERCEIQKSLEIQVDRLFRLKELQFSSMKISPMRSLREKEHGKNSSQDMKGKGMEESTTGSGLESPCSSSSSVSSQLVAVK